MKDLKQSVREYWEKNPNAATIGAGHDSKTREFYEVVAAHRYRVEPCIPEMAEFDRWTAQRVLEVGCGMGTDLRRFAAGGAHVVGLDLTWQGIQMAKDAFRLFGIQGDFVVGDAEALPFKDDVFDLAYSNGVIHHTPDTPAAAGEIHRVLRPGGQARVMIYHRNSYFARVVVGLMLSPVLRILLWLQPGEQLSPFWKSLLPQQLQDLHQILAQRGFSKQLLFSLSTDPSRPGDANANPLARAYSASEARTLFAKFHSVQTTVRQLYYADFLPARLHRWVEHRFGWFLFIRAQK